MAYDIKDYITVNERVAAFKEAFPEGSLQSEWKPVVLGGQEVLVVKAFAYRTPDDPRPGIGHAMEPLPGLTKFTRNSELMVGETSAWGRALAALGFETKHAIASREEIENRPQDAEPTQQMEAIGFASAEQRGFYDRLMRQSIPAAAQSTVTRYLDQAPRITVKAAIDALKDKDTKAIDGLLTEATEWEAKQSDVPWDESQ